MAEELGISMLVASLIDANRLFTQKLDAAIERMATRDDISNLRTEVRSTVGSKEFEITVTALTGRVDSLEAQVNGILADQLPRWFWGTVLGAFGILGPLVTSVIIHFWK